ncbi:MAG TPA: dNTP triphosphohydrolase, partial [Tenuifilaceae bacterium]|nr:dNTP triphosphohydrolase [Tenuifilaceae bacterium]
DTARTNYQHDFDRLIFSSPFRRLQNKTQVFPLPGSIFVHNRLTHSLEVSSVGRSLGQNVYLQISETLSPHEKPLVAEIPGIIAAACLAHDMGNPPFGHSGEEAIRKFFEDNSGVFKPMVDSWEWSDLVRFEGNANALRLLTQQLTGRRTGGFRLSNAVLASVVKYPYPSASGKKKFGFFKSEANPFLSIAHATGMHSVGNMEFCRHPLVYLVEAADDICYQIMDIEDAHKLGILSTPMVVDLYRAFFTDEPKGARDRITSTLKEVQDPNEQVAYLRAIVISKLVEECARIFVDNLKPIMDGEDFSSLLEKISGASHTAMEAIKNLAVERVYNHRKVVEIEIAGYQILGSLLEIFCDAVLHPQTGLSKKVIRLVPNQYMTSSGDDYTKIMSVLDFVSGMTDVYALETYRIIKGINLPTL